MNPLTTNILVACGADRQSAAKYIDWLNKLLPEYGVTTPLRLAHLLGQVMVESDRMKAVHEYASGAEYEGSSGLGNTQKGDGSRYKGRGMIECTGRFNYTAFAKKFGIDAINHPELLEQPEWWVASGLWYWQSRNLNAWADKDDVLSISQIINQGSKPKPGIARKLPNNYADRVAYVNKCKQALAPLFTTMPETA